MFLKSLKSKVQASAELCDTKKTKCMMQDAQSKLGAMTQDAKKKLDDLKANLVPKVDLKEVQDMFLSNMQKYAELYNVNKLFDAISSMAKKAGVKVIYMVLILYNVLVGDKNPSKVRMMVTAALGYFILPVDIIPDVVPVAGFSDDGCALMYVIKTIWGNINSETFTNARASLEKWFGKVDDSELLLSDL